MREIYLKGHGEEFKGGEYNPVTETQESILKAIEIALGETYSVNTSKSAWNVSEESESKLWVVTVAITVAIVSSTVTSPNV